jgi:DNA-binding NarL/FixJ family response regulator
MPADSIRIVLVDDHVLFRQVLRRVLEEEPDLRVVAELSDGARVREVLQETKAELLLLDLDMPRFSGYDVLRELQVNGPPVATLVVTASEDRVEHTVALDLGARGVIRKMTATSELLGSIRALRRGSPTSGRAQTTAGEQSTAERAIEPRREAWEELTQRETEVAALVTEGLRYREISRRLNMSPSTLNNHLRSIFEKLEIHGRVELAAYALRRR